MLLRGKREISMGYQTALCAGKRLMALVVAVVSFLSVLVNARIAAFATDAPALVQCAEATVQPLPCAADTQLQAWCSSCPDLVSLQQRRPPLLANPAVTVYQLAAVRLTSCCVVRQAPSRASPLLLS